MQLAIKGLSKCFNSKKSGKVHAVKNLSFTVNEGEITGLLGPNGAGKTTAIKMICDLVTPSAGTIQFTNNGDYFDYNKSDISVVLEGNRNIYWRLTVGENIKFFSAIKGINPKSIRDRIDHYLNFFDLKEKENELGGKLSRGMQQKLSLVLSMISDSKVVLLDEPTLGLDLKAALDIRAKLKQLAKMEKRILIVSSHDMHFIQDVCNRVIVLNKGCKVVEDSVDNLMELFNYRKYKITIDGRTSDVILDKLKKSSDVFVQKNDLNTQLLLSIDNSRSLYEFIDILKKHKVEIQSISNEMINFENVYVNILEKGGQDDS